MSDFYGGYDSVGCRQQKCLVHLIGDLNDDLWKNPFNEEMEQFVGGVRDLLVPVFEDVERYGLGLQQNSWVRTGVVSSGDVRFLRHGRANE